MALFRSTREASGRPPAHRVSLMRELVCAPDRAEAVRRAGRHLSAKYRHYRHWGQDSVLPSGDRFASDVEVLAADRFAVGDPADCRATLTDWCQRTRATDLILRVHWAGAPIGEA